MKYLRFYVDIEVEEIPSIEEISQIEHVLDAVIDNEYSAWVEYHGVIED